MDKPRWIRAIGERLNPDPTKKLLTEVQGSFQILGASLSTIVEKGRMTSEQASSMTSLGVGLMEHLRGLADKHDIRTTEGRRQLSNEMQTHTELVIEEARKHFPEPMTNFFHAWCSGLLSSELFIFDNGRSRIFYSSPLPPILSVNVR